MYRHAVHFVIMGCGRVGSTIARSLERQGHDVAVIDLEEAAFKRLGRQFEGLTVKGVGFDRETLRRAGIEKAYAFAAVSSGDNSNILAARVARETFGVANVVARIYDPGRAEIYQRLGIPTVATVRWAADQALRQILPQGALPEFTEPSGQLVLTEMPYDVGWIGRPLTQLEADTGSRVAFVDRLGEAMLPARDTVLQADDRLHLLVPRQRLAGVEQQLDAPPQPVA